MFGDIADPPWIGDDGLAYKSEPCDLCDWPHDEELGCIEFDEDD